MQLPFPLNPQSVAHAANTLGLNITDEQVGLAFIIARWVILEVNKIRREGGVPVVFITPWNEFWGIKPKPQLSAADIEVPAVVTPVPPTPPIAKP
jgi:hypothetical protein